MKGDGLMCGETVFSGKRENILFPHRHLSLGSSQERSPISAARVRLPWGFMVSVATLSTWPTLLFYGETPRLRRWSRPRFSAASLDDDGRLMMSQRRCPVVNSLDPAGVTCRKRVHSMFRSRASRFRGLQESFRSSFG